MADQKSILLFKNAVIPAKLISLCESIAQAGGHGWFVGGCLRDMLLGHTPKDFDLEVYGIPAEKLELLLKRLGKVELVGKQFGILKLWMSGLEIDVALPRTEQKTTEGHCGFSVQSDPWLEPEKACLRRDFTINAMMFDPLANRLLDFHNGQDDLKLGILRHVSPAFAEDPLRPLRAMQFAARFKLTLDSDTASLCRSLLKEAQDLPSSRIWNEWKKWALSQSPSYGLAALADCGWLTLYPELEVLIGCEQEARWHPEGDVWNHTLQVCDRAADLSRREALDSDTTVLLLLSALCHDLGKPVTSFINDKGRICSPGHSEAGTGIAKELLKKIATPSRFIKQILPLVQEHITHLHGEPTQRAIRRLADRLEPANIAIWEKLVEADASGRFPAEPSRPAYPWLQLAEQLQHQHRKPNPYLSGKMLIKLGFQPGPAMGEILDRAYQAQLDGIISDQDSALNWYHELSRSANNPG